MGGLKKGEGTGREESIKGAGAPGGRQMCAHALTSNVLPAASQQNVILGPLMPVGPLGNGPLRPLVKTALM